MISLPQLNQLTERVPNRGSKSTVYVQWDRVELRYIVVKPEKGKMRLIGTGRIERDTELEPLTQLAEELRERKLHAKRMIAILSRNDLEVATLNVPPAEEEELPDMVGSLVEQEFGECESGWVVDFTISRKYEDGGAEVIAFALADETLREFAQRAKQEQFVLDAVVPRSLASIGLLRRATSLARPRSVAIAFCNGHIDISVLDRSRPTFLRSVRVATEDPQELAQRTTLEINRCLAAAGAESDDLGQTPHVFVFGNLASHQQYADTLAESLNMPVSLVDPIEHLIVKEELPEDEVYLLSPLIGAAVEDLNGSLDVDLLHPRQTPQAASPVRRWIMIGGALVALLIGTMYVLWSERMELKNELAAAQEEFDNEKELANKMLEGVDDVRAVEAWLQQDVNWLDELRDFSRRLPPGNVVTIRRFSGASQDGAGNINLSVQVSDPADVAVLENNIRSEKHSVTSNRVSERAADEEYPWQFETRVAFQSRSKSEYRPELATSEGNDESEKVVDDGNSEEPPQQQTNNEATDQAKRANDEQPVSVKNEKKGGQQ